ncbi:glycosyltransferase family 2 protein [Hafnia alvei]|uniref:Glycosyl transferase family 2 n=1 Tax=Hafnia alvei TaxID=569 RepID=A0ABD7Q9R4_HAFAL|nr:glycosyltransferase family 2 protein [Hafnia alvei]TBL69140.1 glycosyl transferase family 2 [Hafnia alvei]
MINIVIPMAGYGSRFASEGFVVPKPFISVGGVPMIELVINNLRPTCPHRFIFICQNAHIDQYSVAEKLSSIAPDSIIIGLDSVTDGAACTVLAAETLIDNDTQLMIANADQWVDININDYLHFMEQQSLDGLIMTMKQARDAKWSYVKLNQNGFVTRVVEKIPVSDEATVGIYNFRRGRDFCQLARDMIARNERSQGEFYIAPVYSDFFTQHQARIRVYNIGEIGQGMHGLGTPADLVSFLTHPALDRALLQCVR